VRAIRLALTGGGDTLASDEVTVILEFGRRGPHRDHERE
jgi:hypothetical protein